MGLYKRGQVWWMSFVHQGKQYRRPTKTRDKKVAQRIYDLVKGQIVKGQWFDEKENIIFDELVDLYQKEEDAKDYILQFVPTYMKYFGGRMLSQITRRDLFKFKEIFKATPKQRGGGEITDSRANRALAGLRRLFHFAMSKEYLKDSPFPKEPKSGLFYSEKKNRGKRKYFTEDEVKKIIEALPESPWYLRAMVITGYLLGMRAGELMNLKKADVNLKDGEILLGETKAGEPQTVEMQDELIELFKEWFKKSVISEFVFCQENGEPLKHWHYHKPFKKALEAIGKNEKGWSFHIMRHTTGTQLHLKGASPITIKDQLRHSNIQVTTDFYVGCDLDFQKAQIEKLATILKDVRPASA
jgi:integrase